MTMRMNKNTPMNIDTVIADLAHRVWNDYTTKNTNNYYMSNNHFLTESQQSQYHQAKKHDHHQQLRDAFLDASESPNNNVVETRYVLTLFYYSTGETTMWTFQNNFLSSCAPQVDILFYDVPSE